jgi:hypothetical protein
MCKKRDEIIKALRAGGMEEWDAIAAEVEIGKLSMVGCTTFRDEANKRMVKIVGDASMVDGEDVRRLANRLSEVLRIEKNARVTNERLAQRFYQQLWRT